MPTLLDIIMVTWRSPIRHPFEAVKYIRGQARWPELQGVGLVLPSLQLGICGGQSVSDHGFGISNVHL